MLFGRRRCRRGGDFDGGAVRGGGVAARGQAAGLRVGAVSDDSRGDGANGQRVFPARADPRSAPRGDGARRSVHRVEQGRRARGLCADPTCEHRFGRVGPRETRKRCRVSESGRGFHRRAAESAGVCEPRGAADDRGRFHARAGSARAESDADFRVAALSESERSGVSQEARDVRQRRTGHFPPRRTQARLLRRDAVRPRHVQHHLHAHISRRLRPRPDMGRVSARIPSGKSSASLPVTPMPRSSPISAA